MGFTPKRLRRQIIAAAKRVEARGGRPPWPDHPRALDLMFFIGGDLSAREARWVKNHLASCRACIERKERLARELKRPADPRKVEETLRKLARIMPEDASS